MIQLSSLVNSSVIRFRDIDNPVIHSAAQAHSVSVWITAALLLAALIAGFAWYRYRSGFRCRALRLIHQYQTGRINIDTTLTQLDHCYRQSGACRQAFESQLSVWRFSTERPGPEELKALIASFDSDSKEPAA